MSMPAPPPGGTIRFSASIVFVADPGSLIFKSTDPPGRSIGLGDAHAKTASDLPQDIGWANLAKWMLAEAMTMLTDATTGIIGCVGYCWLSREATTPTAITKYAKAIAYSWLDPSAIGLYVKSRIRVIIDTTIIPIIYINKLFKSLGIARIADLRTVNTCYPL